MLPSVLAFNGLSSNLSSSLAFIFSKSTIETLEKDLKYFRSKQQRNKNVILVPFIFFSVKTEGT